MTDIAARKREIRDRMASTREQTLRLLKHVPDDYLKVRVHDFYSPIGWHFGHIGRTEELWVSEEALGQPALDDRLSLLFVNVPENPKDGRVHLPSRAEIVVYLEETRVRALAELETADIGSADPLLADGYAWNFARLHECQHQETIAELLQLIQKARFAPNSPAPFPIVRGAPLRPCKADFREGGRGVRQFPAATFQMGSDDPHAYDNEKPAHTVAVAAFSIATSPVTSGEWLAFIADRGYERPELWTTEGWSWRESESVTHPEYWQPMDDGTFAYFGIEGLREIDPAEPVSAISWFEADAYARWAGMRLPTEAEWEYAATVFAQENEGQNPMIGGVWEWTASPFLPYPGFIAYPYDGYSKDHMDGDHKVCKGGSWASAPDIARPAFRNWYVPTYRQGFLGVRCAL